MGRVKSALLYPRVYPPPQLELQIKGYASPLHNPQYNQSLSQRRILSLINYLTQFKKGILKEYIYSQKLKITELPLGERNASHKVSDDSNDQKNSVYSPEAMLERKIEIVDVILQEQQTTDLDQKPH